MGKIHVNGPIVSFEVIDGPVIVSEKVSKKIDAMVGKHIEFVKENGPQDKCMGDVPCPYCEKLKRETFEKTYGTGA